MYHGGRLIVIAANLLLYGASFTEEGGWEIQQKHTHTVRKVQRWLRGKSDSILTWVAATNTNRMTRCSPVLSLPPAVTGQVVDISMLMMCFSSSSATLQRPLHCKLAQTHQLFSHWQLPPWNLQHWLFVEAYFLLGFLISTLFLLRKCSVSQPAAQSARSELRNPSMEFTVSQPGLCTSQEDPHKYENMEVLLHRPPGAFKPGALWSLIKGWDLR